QSYWAISKWNSLQSVEQVLARMLKFDFTPQFVLENEGNSLLCSERQLIRIAHLVMIGMMDRGSSEGRVPPLE
ncbi:hypothetical protein RUM43_005741, partial [Polyplax serrata]